MKHLKILFSVLFGLSCVGSHLQGAWQPPLVISDPEIGLDGNCSNVLKVNPEGNAIAVWLGGGFDEFIPVICSAYYDRASNIWFPSEVISGFAINVDGPRDLFLGDPDIAMNSSGYAVAVWEGFYNEDNYNDIVYANTRSPSGNWNPIVTPLSDTNAPNLDDDQISVTLNEAGTALAAWRHTDTSTFISKVAFSFLPFGGSWSPIVYSSTNINDTDENKPYPVINPSGNAVITWVDRPSPTGTVEVAIYNAGLNTFTYTTLDTGPFSRIGNQPRCGMDANGNAIAVWSISKQVKAAYFNGTSWESPIIIETSVSNIASALVVMDLAGNATATWSSDGTVKASSRLPSGAWTAPVSLSLPGEVGDTGTYLSVEQLAVNTTGDVIAIWQKGPFSPSSELLSNYKPFGRDWGPEMIVNNVSDTIEGGIFNIGLADCGFAVALWQNANAGIPGGLIYAAVNDNLILTPDPAVAKCCLKTAISKICVNVLTWTPDSCVIAYNIYCNGVLLTTVLNTGTALQFVDKNACRNCTYSISTITAFGAEGEQVPFIRKSCDCGKAL